MKSVNYNYNKLNGTKIQENKIITKAEYRYKTENNLTYKYTSNYMSTVDIPYKRYNLA